MSTSGFLFALLLFMIFLVAIFSWFYALYHGYNAFKNIREGRKSWVLYHPFGLLMSSYFNEKGNFHRCRMLGGIGVFILLVLLVIASAELKWFVDWQFA